MAIKIKAQERNVSFQEGVKKYAYVLQTDLYNKFYALLVLCPETMCLKGLRV